MAGPVYLRAYAYAYGQNSTNSSVDTGEISNSASASSGPYADFGGTFYAKSYARNDVVAGPLLGTFSDMINTYAPYQSYTLAQSWWSNTFTVIGTIPVTFNLGIHLSAAVHSIKNPGSPDNLGATAFATMTGTGAAAGLTITATTSNSESVSINSAIWKQATYNPGDVVTVGGTLSSDATAQLGSATADAYSTGRFALEVLTPGGGYTTSNGVVFLTSFNTATPEPSTFPLSVLCGIGLLFAVRKRRH